MTFDAKEFERMKEQAEQESRDDGLPRKPFTCPHCGMMQIRKFPWESGNYCNGCQEEMD